MKYKICELCSTEDQFKFAHRYKNLCDRCGARRFRSSDAYKVGRKRRIENQRLKATGFTPKHYNKILIDQNFRCAICNIHASNFKTALAADHDHVTGNTRGLLCHVCNKAIGAFKDDVELLSAAIVYLKQYS